MSFRYVTSVFALLIILGWSVFTPVHAQELPDTVANIPGIEIQTSVDKAEVYIGDLVNYTITVTYDSTIELLPPPLGANLGAFDVKDYQTDISSKLPDGRIKSESRFVLSTFTTGDYVVPPVPMAFELPDGSRKIVLSETVPIKVQSLLLNTDDSVDIRPLKAQFEFQRDWTKYYIWGSIFFIILAALGYFIWQKMRRQKVLGHIDLRPAWEIAFEKLAKLEQKGLVGKRLFKEYYIELTEILRNYLGRMFAANIPDMTTDEFFSNFEIIGIPDDIKENMKKFFNHADLVKFAKFIPEAERCKSDFVYVHDIVERVRKDFQAKAEMEARIAPPSSRMGTPTIIKGAKV